MRLVGAFALAVGAGVAGWAAHPPLGVTPLVLLVVPLLLAAVERATRPGRDTATGGEVASALRPWDRGAATSSPSRLPAAVGLLAGLVTFLPMLAWLIEPAGVAAWLLLCSVEAGWYALVAVLLPRWIRSGWVVLVAPVLWTGMEAWRGLVPFGGFGWGALAYAYTEETLLLPVARVVGASGLSFLTALLGTLAYDAARRVRTAHAQGAPAGASGRAGVPPLAALLVIGVVATIAPPGAPPPSGRTVDLLAVQGNDLVRFEGSWTEEDVAISERLLAETRAAIDSGGRPDLTIWPENSIDVDPFTSTGAFLRRYVTEAVEVVDGHLLFGTNLDGADPDLNYHNAAVMVDRKGEPVDRYVKRRYVPFGEYVPWRSLLSELPPLRQALDRVPRDGLPVAEPQSIATETESFAVVICFETLFSDVVRTNVLADNAGIVLALTNDASFGRSWESDQHIAQSRLRAVETGRWVVHAAISGASALVDPDGRVHHRTGLFERATIRAEVPVASGSTPFLVAGDVVGHLTRWAALALVLAEVTLRLRSRRRTRPRSDLDLAPEARKGRSDDRQGLRADLVAETSRSEEGA